MSPGLLGGISVLVLLAIMAFGFPIGMAMGAVGFAGYAILVMPEAAYEVLAKDIFHVFNSYTMSMVIMFVLMGFLAYRSGIGAQLYAFAHKTLGYLPGGVPWPTKWPAACSVQSAAPVPPPAPPSAVSPCPRCASSSTPTPSPLPASPPPGLWLY